MRTGLVVLVTAAATTLGAASLQAHASSDASPERRLITLERQVLSLNRRVKALALLNVTHTTQILGLQSRDLYVSTLGGPPAVIAPGTWGVASGGLCINGTAISLGFSSDRPVMVGTYQLSAGGLRVAAFNSGSSPALLSTQITCLDLR